MLCDARGEVMCGITPLNFPCTVPCRIFPRALLTGNAFVLKPSEWDPSAPRPCRGRCMNAAAFRFAGKGRMAISVAVLARLAERTRALRVGAGLDEGAQMGPVITRGTSRSVGSASMYRPPVPIAWHGFGGWTSSLLGDTHAYDTGNVPIYTPQKSVRQRWPRAGGGASSICRPEAQWRSRRGGA